MLSKLWRWLLWFIVGWFVASLLIVLALRWVDPPTSAFMLGSRLGALFSGDDQYRFRHQWVDAARISPHMRLAVVASEDQKFPEHWGFDFAQIDKSLSEHRSGKRRRLRGASTLTQQVAKNLFLWQGQSFFRKGLEAYFTLLIEAMWPKQRILEVYLNIAEFGPGVYGVQAAGQYYFRKPAARLGAPECALLAAVLPNPIRYKVNAPSRYVLARQRWILQQMRNLRASESVRFFLHPRPIPVRYDRSP